MPDGLGDERVLMANFTDIALQGAEGASIRIGDGVAIFLRSP